MLDRIGGTGAFLPDRIAGRKDAEEKGKEEKEQNDANPYSFLIFAQEKHQQAEEQQKENRERRGVVPSAN